ncbi:MAG: hypothetical protein ACD_22C00002G0001 [uncultured bacterium]|nr:MAG: hypothetical protein ACD_22C00002G0001 [uncultured bacterium]
MTKSYSQKGFTLIELLIVIVIIGILAGVVLAVMNPAVQQRKANESVLRANTDKVCLAMHACAAARSDAFTTCDTFAEIGVNSPAGTPTGATYAPTAAGTTLTITGTLGTCIFTCTYDTSTGTSTAVTPTVPANCLIQ